MNSKTVFVSKSLSIALLVLTAGITTPLAHAQEGITEIGLQKEMKEQVITLLQTTIARHQAMTKEQILADLQSQIDRNSDTLANHGIHVDSKNVASSLSQFDKDTLVAFEDAKLQSLMTSANAMFWLTRLDMQDAQNNRDDNNNAYGDSMLLPFALVVDIAFLPFEFVISAVSGF